MHIFCYDECAALLKWAQMFNFMRTKRKSKRTRSIDISGSVHCPDGSQAF